MPSLSKLALATLITLAGNAVAGFLDPLYADRAPARRSPIDGIDLLRRRSIGERQNQNVVFTFASFPFEKGTTVNAYITGTRVSDNAQVFVDKNGQWYSPPTNGKNNVNVPASSITIPVPVNTNTQEFNVTLPGEIASGQVLYVVNGTLAFMANAASGQTAIVPPSAANTADMSYNYFWGFSEFTYKGGALTIDASAVDFAGCPNTIAVYNKNGSYVGSADGLEVNAATPMCNSLKSQAAKDGQPWDKLCITNNKNQLVRVISPNILRTGNFGQSNAFNGYYDQYVNQVYTKYSSQPLNIALANNAGSSTCTVSNNVMTCTGDDTSYSKPTSSDIFSCGLATGPFAKAGNESHKYNVARLCAAFQRTTLLLNGGNNQPSGPPSTYYSTAPTNYYAYWAHNNSFSGLGYTFPYDDVTPAGQTDQSGTVHGSTSVGEALFIIGGFGFGGYSSGQYA